MKPSKIVKIQVPVPKKYANRVRLAMGKAGAGRIGNYKYCAFITYGKGYFLAAKGAKPTIGKVGKITQVNEVKIETVCAKNKLAAVIKAIKKAHPYEEVPIDIIPLIRV